MKEYFTIMIQEGATNHLGTLTEKLNDGFYIDNYISVGRSTLLVLQKRVERSSVLTRASEPDTVSYGETLGGI